MLHGRQRLGYDPKTHVNLKRFLTIPVPLKFGILIWILSIIRRGKLLPRLDKWGKSLILQQLSTHSQCSPSSQPVHALVHVYQFRNFHRTPTSIQRFLKNSEFSLNNLRHKLLDRRISDLIWEISQGFNISKFSTLNRLADARGHLNCNRNIERVNPFYCLWQLRFSSYKKRILEM